MRQDRDAFIVMLKYRIDQWRAERDVLAKAREVHLDWAVREDTREVELSVLIAKVGVFLRDEFGELY